MKKQKSARQRKAESEAAVSCPNYPSGKLFKLPFTLFSAYAGLYI